MPFRLFNDGTVDVEGTARRSQYDNGIAAGSPPDFDGPARRSARESLPLTEPDRLPRFGGRKGPGITPNVPQTEPEAPEAPATEIVPPTTLSGPAMPVLRSAEPSTSGQVASRVDWRIVAGVIALVVGLWFVAGRDE